MSKLKLIMVAIDRTKRFSKFFKKYSGVRDIDFLVLHHVGASNLDEAIGLFKEYEVSANFIIGQDGKIFELVEENNIAYHAGISHWAGVNNLNSTSIGIEFFSPDPFKQGFSDQQMEAGLKLCQKLIKTHKIKAKNIVAHSDIGYDKKTGLLNRKTDPSHLFNWKFLAENGVGFYPKIDDSSDRMLFKKGDKAEEILEVKIDLKKFGYKIDNLNNIFDEEMEKLTIVFNRRFNQNSFKSAPEFWYSNSDLMLKKLS